MEDMKFDPMTGKPLGEKKEESVMKFDPMTGKPLGEAEKGSVVQEKVKGKSSKRGALVSTVCVAVVAVILFFGMTNGLFLGRSGKVLLAIKNTIKDASQLQRDIDFTKIITGDKYEVTVSGLVDGNEMDISYSAKNDMKQLKGVVDISYGSEVEFTMQLDNKNLKAQLPLLSDDVYTYNYVDIKKGYIKEQVDDDIIEQIDETLKLIYSTKEQKEMYTRLAKSIISEYKELKFEKAKMQEFEVNDKERKCKGYATVITGKNVENVLSNMKDIIKDYYVSDNEIVECFDDLIDDCDYISEVKVTCYIFKNKIAAIILENEYEDEVIIEFNGGATRTENICVTEFGEKVFEIKGSTEDHIETRKMYQYGYKFGELTYDTKKGDLTIKNDYDEIKLNIDSSAKEIKIKLDDSYIDGENVEGSITISSNPKFEKLAGKTFDVGNASEEEFGDLFYEIEEELEELSYLFYAF